MLVTIRVRRKPLLIVAHVMRWADAGRGSFLNRVGNWLLDRCLVVTAT